MDEVDRSVIQIYIDVLASETNFSELLRKLSKNKHIITPNLKKKYKELQKTGETNISLNRELYKDIQTRGKNAFNILIQCLREVHPHLSEILLPNEMTTAPVEEEDSILSENEAELEEHRGICTVGGDQQSKSNILPGVKKLCHVIRAKYVPDYSYLTQADFHLAIKADGKFQEKDIKFIESLYANHVNLKIIVINIINNVIDNAAENPTTKLEKSSGNPTAVFIVNIHIHQGDHLPSIFNIIREVVANNPGHEIRDIFRVVMEKLAKWCCRLNTESRGFPEFYF